MDGTTLALFCQRSWERIMFAIYFDRKLVLIALLVGQLAYADYLAIQSGNKLQCGSWGCSQIFVNDQGQFFIRYNGRTHIVPLNVVSAILQQPDYTQVDLTPHKLRARSYYNSVGVGTGNSHVKVATSDLPTSPAQSIGAGIPDGRNSQHALNLPQKTNSMSKNNHNRPSNIEAPQACSGKSEDVTLEGKLLGRAGAGPGRVGFVFSTWNGNIVAETRFDSARIARLDSLVGQRVILDRATYFEQRRGDGSCKRSIDMGEVYSQDNLGPSGTYSATSGPGFENIPRPNLSLARYCSERCAPFRWEPRECRVLGIPGMSGVIGSGENKCQAMKELCTKVRSLDSGSGSLNRATYSCINQI
jgi:hypothetical protein